MSKFKSFACALAFACAVPAANASVITFDDFTPPASFSTLTADGFKFTYAYGGYAYIWGPYKTGYNTKASQPYDGSNYYAARYGFTMTSADQSAFSVSSFDLGTWDNGTYSFTFTGNRTDGSKVTQTKSLSSANNINTTDFVNVTLNGFNNLASLQISVSGSLATVDNIVVNANAVPEPASLAIFGLGLAALGGGLRRRKG